MTKPAYTLPDENDPLQGFFSVLNNCGECKHVRDVPDYEWYRMGDLSSDARCALLACPVSSHVGTCTAFKRPLTARIRRLWQRLCTAVNDAYWWVVWRLVPRYRYHLIDTGLKPGYYDPDIRLLAGIFKEVHDYVRDNPFDWTQTEHHRMAWRVFQASDKYGQEYMEKRLTACVTFEEEAEADAKACRHAKKVLDNLGSMWY